MPARSLVSTASSRVDMRSSALYALRRLKDSKLCYFHPVREYVNYVRGYVECDGKIYALYAEETSEEERTHYSYWDYERERFSFTHELISGIIINFPNFDLENKRDKNGVILPVRITERSSKNVRT